MIPVSPTERHPPYWYLERVDFIQMPEGMKKLLCPFCEFSLESKGFHRDREIVDHIEEAHPENIQYVYDRLKSSKREPTQKTLEVL